MPIITLTTNLKSSLFNEEFRKNFIILLAKILNKPVEGISLDLRPDSNYSYGITDESAILIKVQAIGFLGAEENAHHTKHLCDFMKEQLGINSDRVLILFKNLEPYEVGSKGTTVEKLRQQK